MHLGQSRAPSGTTAHVPYQLDSPPPRTVVEEDDDESQQALIVQIWLSGDQWPGPKDQATLDLIETELTATIAEQDLGTIDGNEVGMGRGTLFMYCPSADRLLDAALPTLRRYKGGSKSYAIAGVFLGGDDDGANRHPGYPI